MTGWTPGWHDLVGFVGSAVIIVQYLRSIRGTVDPQGLQFPLTNLIGGGLILVSLWHNLNPPSVAIEIFWSAVSLYGLWRYWRRGRGR